MPNQRDSFRIDETFEAELFHEGRVAPCSVQNLSAGGALVTARLDMPSGSYCTLGIRLDPELAATTGQEYFSFHMEVLEPAPSQLPSAHRLRTASGPGSPEYEAAARLVVAAQRRSRARQTGAVEASPMSHDSEQPRRRRSIFKRRFGKNSTR
ncbi:MAG: hypothetical protein JWO69_949 [Thermoleophilia bacterium]|jgi:hypothetical protein|nr:hypothetical protein [Thermoleophilia bacterium]